MVAGCAAGYLGRTIKIKDGLMNRLFLVLTYLLLFFLGWEVGGNEKTLQALPSLGLKSLLIALITTLGSILGAFALWKSIKSKKGSEEE
ncbi:MAG: LysO family transporter [Bacteroidales bacterium]|nr:LysO family transporter [Bacteroidales bacterium]